MNKELQNLMKYPEFHALEREIRDHINGLKEDFAALDPGDVSFPVEAASLNQTIKALTGFFARLGIIKDSGTRTLDKTYN